MKKMQREPSHNSAMAVMPATAAPDAAASFYKQENEHRASVNGLLLPPDPAPSHSADDRLRSYYLPTSSACYCGHSTIPAWMQKSSPSATAQLFAAEHLLR